MMIVNYFIAIYCYYYYYHDDKDDLDLMATRCWFQEFRLYPSYFGKDFPFERHFPYIFQPNGG